MTMVLPIHMDRAAGSRLTAAPLTPLALAVAVTCMITLARTYGTVDSDVAWQLWIARQINAGANLYNDIIETNPPLWFWMALPVERASAFLQVRIEPVLVVAIGFAIALSLAATDRLIPHIELKRRAALLVFAALLMAAMPWLHVGQREQIVLIGTVPYAALLAARREGRAISPALAALVGIGAALGFALKHYFLAVPAALELWLVIGLGRAWRPLRPEIMTIVAVGVLYAAAIAFLEPDFIADIVPLLQLAYGSFGPPGLAFLLTPHALAGLAVLALVGTQFRTRSSRRAPLSTALTIAAVAFASIYFVQAKGWIYHTLPLIGCASLALAALLAETKPTSLLRMVGPAALILPFALSVLETRYEPAPGRDLTQAVAGLKAGEAVGFLTTETAIPWSVTLQGGYAYPSRYNGFWQMHAITANERTIHPDPDLTALGRQIIAETVADFACTPPRRIIVERPQPAENGFDILHFFLRDPNFAALLSHYRIRSRTSLETYELSSPLPPPQAPCRR